MKLPFGGGKCMGPGCNNILIAQPGELPFCSEYQKKMCSDAERKIKKLRGKKVVLHGEAVER